MTELTREGWLNQAVAGIGKHFHSTTDMVVPATLRVSCGWPHIKAFSTKGRRIGECWPIEASSGGMFEVFISPYLSDAGEVLSTLTHELVHATVGTQAGHGGVFSRFGRKVGLVGRPTNMSASLDLLGAVLLPLATELGPYPHSSLDLTMRLTKKQTTRMLKVACVECGYTARVTTKWLDQVGAPMCPCNSEQMKAAK